MKVRSVCVERTAEGVELSARLEDYRLWFRFPAQYQVSARGDAFLVAALLPAMATGQPLIIENSAPVSPKLLQGAGQLQDIYSQWWPFCRRVEIQAQAAPAEPCNPGVLAFFSGGVDSCYTLLKHRAEITALAFIHGADIPLSSAALHDQALTANQRVATRFGKNLVPVSTNVRSLIDGYKPLAWPHFHGAALFSVAVALAFPKVYVPSTHTYAEYLGYPHGTHPMTDHLWGTEATQIVHDGAEARRTEKLRKVGEDADLLNGLRVCWESDEYNCGKCEKCLRTMISLRLLGLPSTSFPPLRSMDAVANVWISDENEKAFIADNLALAEERGDQELAQALRKSIGSYERRQSVDRFDRTLFGGRLKKLRRRLAQK